MSVWDDPSLSSGDFVKFENPGDEVHGVVRDVALHTWDDGSKCPKLVIETDDGLVTLTAGQVRLKLALSEQRPEVGDHIAIKFTSTEKRAGGKTLKHFDVTVDRAKAGASTSDAPF